MKRSMKIGGLASLAVFGALMISSATVAQTTVVAPTGIPVGNVITSVIVPLIEALASGVITAFIAWGATKFAAVSHVNIEAQHRDALHSAIMSGINLALKKFGGATNTLTLSTHNQVLDQTLSYVLQSVPDALKYLGLDPQHPEKLTDLIESKLAALTGASAVVATVQTGPSAGGKGA